MVEKYKLIHNVNASNIHKIIKEIQEIYNNSYHSVIKDLPINIINKKHEDVNAHQPSSGMSTTNKNNSQNDTFKIGDRVRIYIKDDNNVFNKLSPLWSKNIYTVESFKNGYYKINNIDQLFTYTNLQKVK